MKKTTILLLALFVFMSCSSKEVKQETDESKKAREAFAVAEAVKDAYLKKDLSAIENNTTKEGYREILGATKNFDKADLTFSHKWVEIDKAVVSLKIAWSGTWVVSGHTTEERGTAIFVFEGRPLKLSRIRSSNPFRQPE